MDCHQNWYNLAPIIERTDNTLTMFFVPGIFVFNTVNVESVQSIKSFKSSITTNAKQIIFVENLRFV